MAEFLISGKVTLDAGPVAAGAKQATTEIERMASRGIAGFEAARQKVIDLTKQVGALRNELLQTADPAAQAKLNAALSQTQTQLRAAKTEMRGMTLESRQASESASLLAAQFGVQLPAGLERLIARLPAVQIGLAKAFDALIIFAFMRAVSEAITNWDKFQESLSHAVGPISQLEVKIANMVGLLRDYSQESIAAAEAGKKSVEQGLSLQERRIKMEQDLAVAGKEGVDAVVARGNAAVETLQREQAHADATNRSYFDTMITLQRMATAHEVNLELAKKGKTAAEESVKAAAELANKTRLLQAYGFQVVGYLSQHEQLGISINKLTAEQLQQVVEMVLHQEKVREQIEGTNSALQVAVNLRKQWEAEDELTLSAIDAENAVRKAGLADSKKGADDWMKTMTAASDIQIEAANKAKEQFEKVASSIEGFIDRVFLQARSIADVFHQFLMQMLGSLVKWASREVAAALMGMKQMAGQGSGGGILGALFGGLFGGGGSAFAGGGGGSASALSAAASAGGFAPGWAGGLEAGAITPLGGEIPSAAGGASSGLLGNLAFGGSLGSLGLMGAGAGAGVLGGVSLLGRAGAQGGPLSGAFGGGLAAAGGIALAGGLIGTSVGIGAMAGMAAAFTNPISAIIVGAAIGIGALVGLLGKGKAKRKAAGIEDQFHIAADALVDQYKQRKADYDTVAASLQALEAQTIQQEGQYGGAGRNAIAHIQQMADQRLATLRDIQTIREANAAILAGMSLPEFAKGGLVGAWTDRGILALLHPGEFVMRQSAVDALGTDFLAALNRAPRFDAGGSVSGRSSPAVDQRVFKPTFNLYQLPGESQQAFANRVLKVFKTGMLDGAL